MMMFKKFDDGKLHGVEHSVDLKEKPWNNHPVFQGVKIKHLIQGEDTQGMFSYHLVEIEAGHKIDKHIHENELETHEVIGGSGYCIKTGETLSYEVGTIAILPKNIVHEVHAGNQNLYILAKFFPAMC